MSLWQKMKLVMSNIWTLLEPFVSAFVTQMGQAVLEEAVAVVPIIAAGMASSDGAAKRDAAFQQIKINLASRGIQVGASVIYSAIEAAVQKLKAAHQ